MRKLFGKKVIVYFRQSGFPRMCGVVAREVSDRTSLAVFDSADDRLKIIPYTSIQLVEVLEVGV